VSFTTPIALAFLLLAIPIVLLYLLKQRRRLMEVSTLMFWDRILRDEQTVTSLTKLKKILSLLLQLLFLVLVTLSLTRPFLSGKWTTARRILLMVDTSASMLVQEGAGVRFDLARNQALMVVRGLSMGDSCTLITFAAEIDLAHPFTDNKKDLSEAIRQLTPTHGETNFKPVAHFIENLPADSRDTHVYLISDGAFDPVEIHPPTNTWFAFLRVGAKADNLGISAFSVRPLPSSPRDFQVYLEVTNDSERERTVPVELRINGHLTDAVELTIPAQKNATRTLRQFSAEGGEVEAILSIKDPFPLDNRACALLPSPRRVRVSLVTPEDVFLERALATDDDVLLESIKPEEYRGTGNAQVTIFSGCRPDHAPPGHAIYIGDWPGELALQKRGQISKPLFTDWQREHPVNRHLALHNVSMDRAAGIEAGTEWQRLAMSFNDPLVLLREKPEQKVLVVAFDTQTTDLPLRVAFPILVANAIRYMSGTVSGEHWRSRPVGSILTSSDLARYVQTESGETNLPLRAVALPDGRRILLDQERTFVPVSQVGFYHGETDRNTNTLFASNLSSGRESHIAPSERLPLLSKEPLHEIKEGFRLGFEPWVVLTLLALLLSTAEWGLFHRRVIE